jgi:hypothetical protein
VTAPVPAGPTDAQAELREVLNWLDELEAATGNQPWSATVPGMVHADPAGRLKGRYVASVEHAADAAAIVVAHNALPKLIAAVRAALDAQEAVRRVEALAEELEGYTQRRGRPAPGSYDYGVNLAQADAAECIRRALAGEPLTTPGDNGSGDWMGGPIG